MAASAATPERYRERLATQRRVKVFEAFSEAVEESSALDVPPPVESIVSRDHRGLAPKLPAEAFELARQVYFLQHGTRSDAARAIIAAGLSDTDDLVTVDERLKTWWWREKWPRRSTAASFAIRDANHDGGLYRGRICRGTTSGNGPAPQGKSCAQSALVDSEYCFHHDPRPAYAEARRRQGEKFTAARRADLVPLEPFQCWCDAERSKMLAEAKRRGERLDPKQTGWGLLADAMGIDQSQLWRYMTNQPKRGEAITTIRAKTIVRYLEPLGVGFEEIYGFEPPQGSSSHAVCRCGGHKNHSSRTCRRCYEDSRTGEPCSYVNGRGEPCEVPTLHESGYCAKCRRIVFRVHRPRPGRLSFVTTPMLILALGKYGELPRVAWVARCMWAANAGGVRDVFKQRRSLESALVKQFRKLGWTTPEEAARARARLVAEHGEISWPERDGPVAIEAAGLVPFGPFGQWLAARHDELGSYAKLSERIHMNPDSISKWLRGIVVKTSVRRANVDRALEAWGDGTRYIDLYGGSS